MKSNIIFLLFISIVTIIGCAQSDYDIERSIFHEDPLNPGLPIYSEWGYNTFGAYIDRVPFVSNSDLPSKIIVSQDTLTINLKGILGNSTVAEIKFLFIGYSPKNYEELTTLNEKEWNLKDGNCIVYMNTGSGFKELSIMDDSNFIIKNAQNLYIDKELSKTILSGEFKFKINMGNYKGMAVNKGRFDLSFGYDNFYYF